MTLRSPMIAFLVSLATCVDGHAATRLWTGAAGELWSDGANWSGGSAPSSGDHLVFGSGGLRNFNDLAAHTAFSSLSYTGGRFETRGNAISLGAGGLQVTSPGEVFIGLPVTLIANQTWTIAAHGQAYLRGLDVGHYDTHLNMGRFGRFRFSGPVAGSGDITVRGGSVGFSGAENGLGSATGTLRIANTIVTLGNYHLGHIRLEHADSYLILENGISAGPITALAGRLQPPDIYHRASVGDLSLSPSSTYVDVLLYQSPIGYGQLAVRGTVSLAGATLRVAAQTPYERGAIFRIVDNDGNDPVSGSFKDLPEGARFIPIPLGGGSSEQSFVISYKGGTGNDIVLIADPLPTPIPTLPAFGVIVLISLLSVVAVSLLTGTSR